MGMLSAALFFVISHAKPLEHMSADRPHTMIFSLYVFASITGQFVIHMGYLIIMYNGALSAMPEVSILSALATPNSAAAWHGAVSLLPAETAPARQQVPNSDMLLSFRPCGSVRQCAASHSGATSSSVLCPVPVSHGPQAVQANGDVH